MVAFTGDYDDLNGKPSNFPPSSHKHVKADITDFPSFMPASDVQAWAKAANKPSYSWGEIGSKPSTFPPSSHTHALENITDLSGLLKVDDLELILKEYPKGEVSVLIEESPGARYKFINIKNKGHQIRVYTYKVQFGGMILDTNSSKIGIFVSESEENGIFILKYNNSVKTCLMPSTDGMTDLGHSSWRWGNIYSINSAVSTSDRKVKKEISYIGNASREYSSTYMDDAQLISLMLGLKACVYKFIDNDSNRPHHGLIAQDVEELLQKLGIKDHAALIKSPKIRDVETEEEYTDEDGSKKTRKKIIQEEIPGEYKSEK